jgi:hypothetical protein
MRYAIALLLMMASAHAADVAVNEDEQKAILQICTIASKSQTLDLQGTAGVANWCVQWQGKIQSAGKVASEPKKDDSNGK